MDTKPSQSNGRVGELVHRITDDVKLIARDEVELARQELQHTAKVAASEAAVILLGAIVALVGLGMLCVVAVVALAPLIHPLWARLLIMSIVYLAIGGALAATFAKRLKTDIVPDLKPAGYEARRTLAGVKSTLSNTAS